MSVSLIHAAISNDETVIVTETSRNWTDIKAITSDDGFAGVLPISDVTIYTIALLLEDARLANGETVSSYPKDVEDQYSPSTFVAGFGPSMLGESTFRQVRTLLEADQNGDKAVALFDLITERGLQVSFNGKDHCFARMTAVNWRADEIEINRCKSSMVAIFEVLGLGHTKQDQCSDDIPLEVFEKAVNDNGAYTDMQERLQAFVDCAKRNGSTHVYWA